MPNQLIFDPHSTSNDISITLMRGRDKHVHTSTTTHLILRHSSGIFMYYCTTRNKFSRY